MPPRRWLSGSVVASILIGVAVARADEPTPERLLAQMTLDEKLTMLEGQAEPEGADKQYGAGYLPGVPRLGIPALRLADGPPGVATRQPSTGMTCTMGVAATFSVEDARRNGEVIGRDAKAIGQDVVLEPYINLDRDTAWARGFNTFGEDPLLTGLIAAAEITGIQSQGVMAQAKHFIAFEGSYNVALDEQTLHEVYLPPFARAVEAGVASIMCAYNVVNGSQACGSAELLSELLRNELGFEGFVTSDWGANHATTYLNAGLDLEMPGGGPAAGVAMPSYFAPSALRRALANGSVREATIDRAVLRILRQYQRFGLLSRTKRAAPPQDRSANAAIVRATAADAATLLKNDDAILPLSARALASLAIIGPGGAQTIATNGGGEKPGGIASRQIGARSALQREHAHVEYAVGADLVGRAIPASVLSHDRVPGLLRTDRARAKTAIDPQLAFVSSQANALEVGAATSWTGALRIDDAGDYDLNVQALGATAKLIVDGKVINVVGSGMTEAPRYGVVHESDGNAPVPTPDGLANSRARLTLSRGEHPIEVIETADLSQQPVQVRLAWTTPNDRKAERALAIATAKRADTAIVFAWSDGDLSKPLPDEQDALIGEVAKANPNTIVVLNSSQPIAMPWLPGVKAVLAMWYPGDEGGWATADVLLGRVNPGGHLPFTWPATIEQTLAHQSEHLERSSRGVGGVGECSAFGANTGHNCGLTRYSEGVQIGYRFFDATEQTPLFPFGFGLSYTSFAYSKLRVESEADGALSVRFRVSNRGARAGDVTPQVYLEAPRQPPARVQFARRALAGFTRARVAAGASVELSVRVPVRQLQYWSTTQGWTTAIGPRDLVVASDARRVALRQTIDVRE